MSDAPAAPAAPKKPVLVLESPEPVELPEPDTAQQMVRLEAPLAAKVDAQLQSYVDALMQGDPNSEEFRHRVDQAFSLGAKEMAAAATVNNRFTKENLRGIEDTHAYKAVAELRALMESLNPARHGDLFAGGKVFGIPLPFMDRMKQYFRKYESAETQLDAIQAEIESGRDEIQRDIAELKVGASQLWDALQKLTGAEEFLAGLDRELSGRIEALRATEPDRARAFEQEVLYYARRNLEGIASLKAVTIVNYLQCRELQKTAREVIRGCDEMNTIGRAALSQAVMLARATGNQIAVQKMVEQGRQTVRGLLEHNARAFGDHARAVAQSAAEPVVQAQQLQKLFDDTFAAIDVLEKFRSEALAVMEKNLQTVGEANRRAMQRIENERRVLAAGPGGAPLDLG